MDWFTPVTLYGTHVTLVPLTQSHHDGLVAAVSDGKLWELWYTSVPSPTSMRTEIDRRLGLQREGKMIPFTIIHNASGRPCGMTTFMNVDVVNARAEVGSTWYEKSVQRTAVNTEAKLLLLTHAFESLHCIAVEFRTHILNIASRRGIERLGAKLDGVLRNHQRLPNGTLRDTCVYSIIQSEWSTVKAHLAWQLQRQRE